MVAPPLNGPIVPASRAARQAASARGWTITYDRAAFVNPPRFTFGDAGRFLPENRAPGLETWDVSFAKTLVIRESMRLMLRVETFNLLNRANFLSPAVAFNTAQFGTISASENPRWIQLALKLTF